MLLLQTRLFLGVGAIKSKLNLKQLGVNVIHSQGEVSLQNWSACAIAINTKVTTTTGSGSWCAEKYFSTSDSNMGESQKALLEQAKKLAAYQAVDEHVKDGFVLGIGSGTTAVYAVDRIAERVKAENLNVVCIPTSCQAKDLIIKNRLRLSELDVHYPIDVTIDGCDECDPDMNIIKGGGGCLLQEKIVASASKKLIIVGDFTKECQFLGEKWKKGVPLEVAQMGSRVVLDRLQKFTESVGSSTPTKVRQAVSKMGPVITDNGNFCVDFQIGEVFKNGGGGGEKHTPESLNAWLRTIPGILETGLFLGMANQAYFGQADGTVRKTKEKSYKNGV